MSGKAFLLLWSAAGLLWWILALFLSLRARRAVPPVSSSPADGPAPSLSVFKPVPPLGGRPFDPAGLASFAAQLGAGDEMLLGIHAADREAMGPVLDRLRRAHPAAKLKVVERPASSSPAAPANPKIAGQRLLAREAEGELWLWSDADIVAPPGFLAAARAELARDGAGMVTFPYVVREAAAAPAVFDALFVDVEFYPGVLLLRRLGAVDFGLGAGMLFRRDEFLRRADWDRLEASLADDFVLGRMLRPVRLGGITLATRADAGSWREALDRYLRWHKTVRWCRPLGFAAQLLVLPTLGWIAALLAGPDRAAALAGLAALVAAEALCAVALCRAAGCRLRPRDLPAVLLWSLGRGFVWLACWLPWPVVWRRQVWRQARLEMPRAGA
jgi:ceramide glucosyltransferase